MTHNDVCYKKMAGTSAVFLREDFTGPSPVERDGLVWTSNELHLSEFPELCQLEPMANVLALEGLEEYAPPSHGDIRLVNSLGVNFVYWEPIKGWIQY